ncbi:hypothetical protein [Stenotrophomonas sp. CFBP 13718]|uniref:hypothetical protein n=1 Tax=Stenotrophomonas sp. CFBP 13718 TaxID=2775304 RepID=UPI001781A5C4|nr:hypothetical protein [Stenotrophomonas sp. CFBP 13718]MBD8696611.1 hypothetical protein [Stenotrophomonas sp. CFBP 13718]
MTTDPFVQAARNFVDSQRVQAMEELLQYESDMVDDRCAGVLRQLLHPDQKPLTPNQQYIYDALIEPRLAEKCSNCTTFVPAGVDNCQNCDIRYG